MEIDCQIWKNTTLRRSSIEEFLVDVEEYKAEGRTRKLQKCRNCGQLYLYEYHEFFNWGDAEDDYTIFWVPVQSAKAAKDIHQNNENLFDFSSIRVYYDCYFFEEKAPERIIK